MEIAPRLLDLMSSVSMEKVRGFVEESAKTMFSNDNVTINLWPFLITGFILLLALPVILSTISSLYVPFHSMYKIASESHHGYGRSDYEDEDYDGYDRWDSEFRRRRRPSKRPRNDDDDEDDYYNDSWKNSDYYKSWDRQNRELEDGTEVARNMAVSLADTVSNAVKMLN